MIPKFHWPLTKLFLQLFYLTYDLLNCVNCVNGNYDREDVSPMQAPCHKSRVSRFAMLYVVVSMFNVQLFLFCLCVCVLVCSVLAGHPVVFINFYHAAPKS